MSLSGVRVRLTATGFEQPLVVEPFVPEAPTGAQVLLGVEAAGVCHRDLIDRAGRVPFLRVPITLGHEVCARVLAVGPEVTKYQPGDRVGTLHRDACGQCAACQRGETSLCEGASFVLGILADGGYATHLTAPESALFPLPEELTAAQAAVVHCTFGTAYRGLKAAGVGPGQTVLVSGANGGVGLAAVQVARRLGAQVVALVRDAAHEPLLRERGASQVVVAGPGATGRELPAVDVAIDCVGQPTFAALLRALKLGGKIVAIGNVTPEKVSFNLGLVIVKALRVIGSSGATARDMAELFALGGSFRLPIDAELPLERAEAAHTRVRSGGLAGRVVLIPPALTDGKSASH